jgi:hypothetical protein
MQTSERHQIRAGEGGDEFDAAGFAEFKLQHRDPSGEHGQNEDGINHNSLFANGLQ